MRYVRLSLPAVALCALLALWPAALDTAHATSPSPTPTGDSTTTLRMGVAKDFDIINPLATFSSLGWWCALYGYESLTWYDKGYDVQPALAKSWEFSEDERTITYHLREDVRWSDGKPFTSEDVMFSLRLYIDQPIYNWLAEVDWIKEIEAPNPLTVKITGRTPTVKTLNMNCPILPKHVWSSIPDDELLTYSGLPVVTTAPFVITAAERGKYIRLERNTSYWGDRPSIGEAWWYIYTTTDSMVQDFRQGKIDVAHEMTTAQAQALADREGTTVSTNAGFAWVGIGLNCSDQGKRAGSPLADSTVRRAIRGALDIPKMVRTAFGTYGTEAHGIVSPVTSQWFWDVDESQVIAYDPAEANRLLDESGYVDTDNDGVREKPNGRPFTLELTASSSYPYSTTWMKMASSDLAAVGIHASVQSMEENTMYDAVYAGELDAWFAGWYGAPDPDYVLSIYTTDQIGLNNESFWSDESYDRAYARQRATLNNETRKPLVDECQMILYEQSPVIPITYEPVFDAYNTKDWANWLAIPSKGGFVLDTKLDAQMLTAVRPVAAVAEETGDLSGGTIAAIVAAAVVVLASGGLILARSLRSRRRLEEHH